MTANVDTSSNNNKSLLRRGILLEAITLGWNIIGVIVLAISAIDASSVALGGFGLDSLIEIGASTVVVWELTDTGQTRQRRALRLIGMLFMLLALYLSIQSLIMLTMHYRSSPSPLGMAWTTATAVVMISLAIGKTRVGNKLNNSVLLTEGKVTIIDALLAIAVLIGLVLNSILGWWWADPLSSYVLVYYGIKEALEIFRTNR